MDFMHDVLADGTKIRRLTIVDTFSRESIALELDDGFKSPQVVEALWRAVAQRELPSASTAITAPSSSRCTSTSGHIARA